MERLKNLEEGKYYIISFDDESTFSKNITLIEIKVLIKLKKSIKILFVDTNEIRWKPTHHYIQIFDEIPIKYYRKDKLEKINTLNEN